MAIFFIADLHLSEKEPAITSNFLHFLHKEVRSASALYILGDFFDYWIGDDDPSLLHEAIARELKELQNKGIYCYFIHGNRDFLLGKKFAKKSGMILLPTEKVLTLHGQNILILHGDILCATDITYQLYRKHIYNRWLQHLFLMLPLSIRRYIAERMRKNSQVTTKLKPKYIIDVNEQIVIEKFQKHQVDWMIHGHTHHSAIYKIDSNNTDNGKVLYRAALGSWKQNGSAIKITTKNIELLHFHYH